MVQLYQNPVSEYLSSFLGRHLVPDSREGLAAHAANAYLGVNAISKATLIIQALDTCNEEKRTRVQHPLYCGDNHNPFNINMGQIHGGTIATSVPDEVVIEGRIAFSPDEDVVDAKKVVEDAVVNGRRTGLLVAGASARGGVA